MMSHETIYLVYKNLKGKIKSNDDFRLKIVGNSPRPQLAIVIIYNTQFVYLIDIFHQ